MKLKKVSPKNVLSNGKCYEGDFNIHTYYKTVIVRNNFARKVCE